MEKNNLIVLPEAPRPITKIGTFEIATSGIDEVYQGYGADPFGGSSGPGLRVPTLATALAAAAARVEPKDCRYLLLLAVFSLPEGVKAKIQGYRQLVKLGYKQATDVGPYVWEQIVDDPTWHFSDGNVSFHIHQFGPPNFQGLAPPDFRPQDVRNFKFRSSTTPAVLYETAVLPALDQYYVDLTSYTPPNLGRPWGVPIRSGMGTFMDQRVEWRTHGGWHSLDAGIEGPCTVGMFASVRQTNPLTRPVGTPPGTPISGGMSTEDAFVQGFPNCIYWRVGGSMIVEVG